MLLVLVNERSVKPEFFHVVVNDISYANIDRAGRNREFFARYKSRVDCPIGAKRRRRDTARQGSESRRALRPTRIVISGLLESGGNCRRRL